MPLQLSHRARILLTAAVTAVAVFVLLAGGGLLALDWYFSQRVFPGVNYGTMQLGGLTREEANDVLSHWRDQWWTQQLQFVASDEEGRVLAAVSTYPIIVSDEDAQSYDLAAYDFEPMLDRAFLYGRDSSFIRRIPNMVTGFFQDVFLTPIVSVNREKLKLLLQQRLAGFETLPADAGLINRTSFMPPQITAEKPGNTFDYDRAIDDEQSSLLAMHPQPVSIHRSYRVPAVTAADAQRALQSYPTLVKQFPVTIMYDDPAAGFVRRWDVSWPSVYNALTVVPVVGGQPALRLDSTKLETVWVPIESAVNVGAQDAKFEIGEDKKVKQFQPSRTGVAVDREATFQQLNAVLAAGINDGGTSQPNPEKIPVLLVVKTTVPNVTTENVNDLGVTEVLGVGYSNYGASPANRIHNISVGLNRLNGTLIPPGQVFSLLAALRPFTEAAGYKPELVIKGDKIEPEIGGGLCQIGSTTFRAAMNSGLPIVERSNHSLVVSYYNDPRNHNPGTDATIYDPAPDLKFTNDTGHFILITTVMNRSNGDLTFTFWGTSDGRKAEYSQPIVSKWIPAGPDKLVESPDLAPGEKKCQAAHPGAVASFTYTIVKPDGTKTDQVFNSIYRSLPKICLVGVDSTTPPTELPGPETPAGVAPDGSPVDFSG